MYRISVFWSSSSGSCMTTVRGLPHSSSSCAAAFPCVIALIEISMESNKAVESNLLNIVFPFRSVRHKFTLAKDFVLFDTQPSSSLFRAIRSLRTTSQHHNLSRRNQPLPTGSYWADGVHNDVRGVAKSGRICQRL